MFLLESVRRRRGRFRRWACCCGIAGATLIVRYTSGVVELAGGVAQRVTELSVSPELIAAGLGIGIVTSLIAAWLPARSAARIDPVKALQKGKYQVPTTVETRLKLRLAFCLIVVSAVCPQFTGSKVLFYTGYASMVGAGLLLAPALTQWLAKALRPLLKRALPVEGALAADSLVQSPRRTAATVGALMLSVSMVVAFGGFIDAFYASVGEWLDNVLNPDFLVSASANLTARRMTFPADLGAVVAAVDGVDQVQLIRNARLLVHQLPVMVMAIETEKIAAVTQRSMIAGNERDMYRLTARGEGLFVSGAFATNNNLGLNDVVDLPTPTGTLRLPIVGIVRDYSDMRGSLFIDRAVYTRRWKDDTVNTARVYVKKGHDVAEVRKRVLAALAGHGRLLVLTNREVRGWITDLLDQWFVLTYNQIIIAILVAVLGIVNTLTVSIADRRRELGVMRAVGGLRRQIRHTMWLEAVSIAIIGLVLGILMGSVNLYYSLGMVKRDLGGFDLDYVFPVAFVLLTIPTILAASFVAAIGPGESAVRARLVEALEYE